MLVESLRSRNLRWPAMGLLILGLVPFTCAASGPEEVAMNAETNLLFIHHSCGGQLLADPGAPQGGESGSGNRCIYDSHPNGGGLRAKLELDGYQVNELSYESRLGEDTDINHWRAKFTEHMADLLRTARQDRFLPEGESNQIVVFKSCYPNNDYVGWGDEPGDPDSPVRTVANSKAAYRSLLPVFQQYPDVLFVAFTAPPLAQPKPQGMKARIKSLFGSGSNSADLAREFNDWLSRPETGWLAEYPLNNVAVFDYYDVLTGEGKDNWAQYATRNGTDSHPSKEGNGLAAEAFLSFLAEAVTDWRAAH